MIAFARKVLYVAMLTACIASPASASGPLRTAVFDPITFPGAPAESFAHVNAAGATYVRILVDLGSVAPGGTTRPASFDPTDPMDPAWNWSSVDDQVKAAFAAGLEPIICLSGAPAWARDPTSSNYVRPSSVWFGKLAEGVARRYGGGVASLPRVTYWQAWNEPNLGTNLLPQRGSSSLIAPDWYRRMVSAFSRGVKRVHDDNLVIAGGLAPYAATTGPGIPPLTFMKQFLCVTTFQIRPRPRCLDRAVFDIWAIQPYTWGGPTHHATVDGDLALGDLPTMKALLDQAESSGRIVSSAPVQFWATEFSWDTNPPDSGAVDIDLQTRWTSEALYRMWQSGISLVTWFLIRDQPPPSRFQSGLYFNGGSLAADTPKPTLEAFRFPTVAFVESGGIRVWTRTPGGVSGTVTFEQDTGNGIWVPLATLATDSNGIATSLIASASTSGSVRAVWNTETSIPFSLATVPDRDVNPFGN